ncbi:MAG: PI-PLC domain-containing protein [Candidatus Binatia bacterium]
MMRNPSPPRLLFAIAATAALATAASGAAAAAPPSAFVCNAASRKAGTPKPLPVPVVTVADQFATLDATVKQVDRLCAPASTTGTPPADVATHLVRHGAKAAGPAAKIRGVAVENALGSHALDLGHASSVLLPSAVDANAAPAPLDFASHAVDRYACRSAKFAGKAADFPAKGAIVPLTGADGTTEDYEILRPKRLCAAADVGADAKKNAAWHLACYVARAASVTRTDGLHVNDGFGAQVLSGAATKEVCLPSRVVYACNGAPELCDRRYDQVAYATTHNAMSNEEDGFSLPNQKFSVKHQLADGIRGLMLDTYLDGGTPMLCHAFCTLGKRPLVDTLTDIRQFLESHPYEIVTIIFESYISANDTRLTFEAAGLTPYLDVQPVASPWPTLRQMIATDRRLVVFTDNQGGTYDWYHNVWAYAFETHYSFATPANLSCTPNRGNPANDLFILNHFLTQTFGSPTLAEQINHDPLFIDRANQCAAEDAHLPNFVTVDHYQIGDVFPVVDALNGL